MKNWIRVTSILLLLFCHQSSALSCRSHNGEVDWWVMIKLPHIRKGPARSTDYLYYDSIMEMSKANKFIYRTGFNEATSPLAIAMGDLLDDKVCTDFMAYNNDFGETGPSHFTTTDKTVKGAGIHEKGLLGYYDDVSGMKTGIFIQHTLPNFPYIKENGKPITDKKGEHLNDYKLPYASGKNLPLPSNIQPDGKYRPAQHVLCLSLDSDAYKSISELLSQIPRQPTEHYFVRTDKTNFKEFQVQKTTNPDIKAKVGQTNIYGYAYKFQTQGAQNIWDYMSQKGLFGKYLVILAVHRDLEENKENNLESYNPMGQFEDSICKWEEGQLKYKWSSKRLEVANTFPGEHSKIGFLADKTHQGVNFDVCFSGGNHFGYSKSSIAICLDTPNLLFAFYHLNSRVMTTLSKSTRKGPKKQVPPAKKIIVPPPQAKKQVPPAKTIIVPPPQEKKKDDKFTVKLYVDLPPLHPPGSIKNNNNQVLNSKNNNNNNNPIKMKIPQLDLGDFEYEHLGDCLVAGEIYFLKLTLAKNKNKGLKGISACLDSITMLEQVEWQFGYGELFRERDVYLENCNEFLNSYGYLSLHEDIYNNKYKNFNKE